MKSLKAYILYNKELAIHLLVILKMLLLQQWFIFSDRYLPEAIKNSLSFKSFLGLPLSDMIPDNATFCHFEQKVQEKDLFEELLLDLQFERLGILVKGGSFIDATKF